MSQYVKIYCCGDCVYYNWKEHNCGRGAHEVGKPRDTFYQDCPLGLYEEEDNENNKTAKVIIKKQDNKSLASLGIVFGDERFFCGNCKYELDINSDYYCPKCGTKIIWRPKEE